MRIRDAASIVLLDRRGPSPMVLMGKRAAKHKFMPNIYVFPGGRVDYGDRFAPHEVDFHADQLDLLLQRMKGRASALRARMMGNAAIRETYEEVGLMLCQKASKPLRYAQPSWAPFAGAGLTPDLSTLTYFARAITPPGQNRRFDTRFFLADITALLEDQTPTSSHELEDVRWVSLKDGLNDLPMHPITLQVLQCAQKALGEQAKGKTPTVTFYQPRKTAKGLVKNVLYLRPGEEPASGDIVRID